MTSEAKDYSKMIFDLCNEKGASVGEIMNSSIALMAKLYCMHKDVVVDLEEQAMSIKKGFIDMVHQIDDRVGITDRQEKKEINKETRVQNLVDRFVKICESEDIEDIVQSVIIFLSAIHMNGVDDSIPLERHAENLKQDFIKCCKSAKKITVH